MKLIGQQKKKKWNFPKELRCRLTYKNDFEEISEKGDNL